MPRQPGGYDNAAFQVFKNGEQVNLNVNWFSLKLDGSDPHALNALEAYAESVKDENPDLAEDLFRLLEEVT